MTGSFTSKGSNVTPLLHKSNWPTTDRWTTDSAELIMPQRCDTQVLYVLSQGLPNNARRLHMPLGIRFTIPYLFLVKFFGLKLLAAGVSRLLQLIPPMCVYLHRTFYGQAAISSTQGLTQTILLGPSSGFHQVTCPNYIQHTVYHTSIVNFTLTVNKC